MLAVQPAVTTLKAVIKSSERDGRSGVKGILEVEGGSKMGLLYDIVQNTLRMTTIRHEVQWAIFSKGEEGTKVENPKSENDVDGGLGNMESRHGQSTRPEQEESRDYLTYFFYQSTSCNMRSFCRYAPEFKSDGYQDVTIKYSERTLSRY